VCVLRLGNCVTVLTGSGENDWPRPGSTSESLSLQSRCRKATRRAHTLAPQHLTCAPQLASVPPAMDHVMCVCVPFALPCIDFFFLKKSFFVNELRLGNSESHSHRVSWIPRLYHRASHAHACAETIYSAVRDSTYSSCLLQVRP